MKRRIKSLIPFGLVCAVVVAAFASGASTSCTEIKKDNDKFILVTAGEDIEINDGCLLKIEKSYGDTLLVREISDDDCRALLEEHGQG